VQFFNILAELKKIDKVLCFELLSHQLAKKSARHVVSNPVIGFRVSKRKQCITTTKNFTLI
jgi:hypothetical protein